MNGLGFISPNNLPLSEANRNAITVGDLVKFLFEIIFNTSKYNFVSTISIDNANKLKMIFTELVDELESDDFKIKLKDFYSVYCKYQKYSPNNAGYLDKFKKFTYYYLKGIDPNNIAKYLWDLMISNVSSGGFGLSSKLTSTVKFVEIQQDPNFKQQLVPQLNARLYNVLPGISYVKTTRNLAGYGGFYHLENILKSTKGDIANMQKNWPLTIKNLLFPIFINFSATTVKNFIAKIIGIDPKSEAVSSIYNGMLQIALGQMKNLFEDKEITGAIQYFTKGTIPVGFDWSKVKPCQLMIAFAKSMGQIGQVNEQLISRLRNLKNYQAPSTQKLVAGWE